MAFSTGPALGGGRSRFRGGNPALAEINIIPLVDVVLVLLIIFMLTASVMEFGVKVDVPKTRVTANTAQELPVVSVTKTGDLRLGDQIVNINELGALVKTRYKGATAVYLRADKATPWDVPVQVMSAMQEVGLKVNIVTKPYEEGRGR